MSHPNTRAWVHNGTYVAVERHQDETTGEWSVLVRNGAGRLLAYRRKLVKSDLEEATTELLAEVTS